MLFRSAVPFPFNFTFYGTTYTGCYVGSNAYVTFGSGSTAWSGLSASNPALNKIMINAGDHSYQQVGYLSTSNYVRIRYEGGTGTVGNTGASTCMYEMVFLNPSIFSTPTIELRIGAWANPGGITGLCSSSAALSFGTFVPAANQSYVFVGDSTGTNWTTYTGYYIAGI